jgi:phage FluMu protein Com
MKIEVTCAKCQSLLRVDEEHLGKMMRCPVCSEINTISTVSRSEPLAGEYGSYELFEPPPSPFAPPMSDWTAGGAQPANRFEGRTNNPDGVSLMLGITGIILNCSCGCLFPVWLVLNGVGLYMALKSNGPLRKAAIVTNTIAIIIGLIMVFVFLARFAV